MNQFLLNSHASQVCVRVCVLCAIVHRRIQSRLRLRLKECSREREREGEEDKPNQTEQHSDSAIVTSMGNGSTHTHIHSHSDTHTLVWGHSSPWHMLERMQELEQQQQSTRILWKLNELHYFCAFEICNSMSTTQRPLRIPGRNHGHV